MKLIVGLGNPGKAYAHSRHNIGFRCLDYFAKIHGIRLERRQCRAKVGLAEVSSQQLLLAKPRTYMNMSGDAVACLVRKHGISPSHLLVIYDDLDLPAGRIRVRQKGGSGGHKGVKSIISALGSEDIPRIRVGIGRPEGEEQPISDDAIVAYVLSDFSSGEEELMRPAIVKVADVIEVFLTHCMQAAMNKFN